MAGGEFRQAAVFNRLFDTEILLYLSNQNIWISQWSGVPG